MKQIKYLLPVIALVVAFSGTAFAQTQIDASAEVVTSLTNVQEQEVNFDVIDQDWTTDPSIDPSDGSTTDPSTSGFNSSTNATVGLVSVTGTAGATVQVTVANSITLTNGTDNITFNPVYNWSFDNLTSGAPTNPEGSNVSADFTMTLDGSTDADGINTILIGGSLSKAAGNLSSGSYTGNSTITIDYL